MARSRRTTDLPPIFARKDAYSAGFTPRQLNRRGLKRRACGVYTSRTDIDHRELLLARARTVPDSVIASKSAAYLYGFRTIEPAELYLYTLSNRRVQQKESVQLRSVLGQSDYRYVDGQLITTPERTFLDLGCVLSAQELVYVADGLLAYHRPSRANEVRIDRDILTEYVVNARYHRGKKKCLEALEKAEVGSDSVKETELRLLLADYGLTGFTLNPVIRDEWGNYICEPDLADFEKKVSVQYEGFHHGSLAQMRKDDERRRRTELLGWREVRIFAADLYQFVAYQGDLVPVAVAKVLRVRGF